MIQRIIEVISAIPSIPLWLALSAAIPPGISVTAMYLYITIILSFIGWTGLARTVRGRFIALRKEDFVMAAVWRASATSRSSSSTWSPAF